MAKERATKKDVEVLYQIDSDISDPVKIAEILPHLDLKDVRKTLTDLRKKGLIRTEEDRPVLTERGKKALKAHHKWIFG
jgi:hypothetical protein